MPNRSGYRIVIVFCLLCFSLVFTNSTVTQVVSSESVVALSFGTVISGAISTAGEEDAYTFTANAGDVILARMSKTSGGVDPYLRITNASGETVCSEYDYYDLAEIAACTVSATEIYTLRAADYNFTKTGNYSLYVQRLNAPGNAETLNYGSTQSDSISATALLNTYEIAAQAGDRLVVQATVTTGEVDPEVRVYDPDGELRCSDYSTYDPAFVDSCSLLQDGPYTLLVGDRYGRHTGVYNVHAQRINTPAGSSALPDARIQAGTLAAAAELDAYVFSGEVGDILIMRGVATSAGGLDPQIRIYDPNHAQVCEAHNYSYTSITELTGCALATPGTYTMLLADYGGSEVGTYELYLLRTNDPVGAYSLAYGETQVKATNHAAQMDGYTFQGNAGDVVAGHLGVPDRSFDPQFLVYGADGTLVCRDHAYTSVSAQGVYVHCMLPSDQAYVALVSSYKGSSRTTFGTYNLEFQRLNPPVNPAGLSFGVSVDGTITPAGEWDTYAFRAASGDVVTVRMSADQGSVDPHIRLYGTDGVKLCEDYAYTNYVSGKAECMGSTLPFSGTYTILVSTHNAEKVGGYTVSLICDSESCGFPLVLNEKVYLPLAMRQ